MKLASSKKKVMITSHVQGVCTIKYDNMLAAKFTTKKRRPRRFIFLPLTNFPFLVMNLSLNSLGNNFLPIMNILKSLRHNWIKYK